MARTTAEQRAQTHANFDLRRLRGVLAEKRITHTEFARACGLHRAFLGKVLTGAIEPGELACIKIEHGINALGLNLMERDRSIDELERENAAMREIVRIVADWASEDYLQDKTVICPFCRMSWLLPSGTRMHDADCIIPKARELLSKENA